MTMRWIRSRPNAGFSLVEILLVIVIILMLAGALVIFVLPQQEGAQRNTTRLKLEQIEQALQLYKTNVGTYPSEEQGGLAALVRKPNFENARIGERWAGPYLKRGATLDDAWGNTIVYKMRDRTLTGDTAGPEYELYSIGPDGQPDTEDDIRLYDVEGIEGGAGTPADIGTPPVGPGTGGGVPALPGPGRTR